MLFHGPAGNGRMEDRGQGGSSGGREGGDSFDHPLTASFSWAPTTSSLPTATARCLSPLSLSLSLRAAQRLSSRCTHGLACPGTNHVSYTALPVLWVVQGSVCGGLMRLKCLLAPSFIPKTLKELMFSCY